MRRLAVTVTGSVAVAVVFFSVLGSAAGAVRAPGFTIGSFASPTRFSAADNTGCAENPEHCDEYRVAVSNIGAAGTDGTPVTVTDVLPAGLTVTAVSMEGASCSAGPPVQCVFEGVVARDRHLEMSVQVTVGSSLSGALTNRVSVSGGGAPEVSASESNEADGAPPVFGFSGFTFRPVGADGLFDSQAGDHPYELSIAIGLNNELRVASDLEGGTRDKTSVQDIKDVALDLPLGFVGSTLATPQCTFAQLGSLQRCPKDTTVGYIQTQNSANTPGAESPIWNMAPEHGYPAALGYIDLLKGAHVLYARVVPSPTGYVLETVSPDLPQISLDQIFVTIYGDPAERDETGQSDIPFFTNPAVCNAGGMTASIHMDSWLHPGRVFADGSPDFSDPAWVSRTSTSPPPTGCNVLEFSPELSAQPTTHQADTPSGLDFETKIPHSEAVGLPATPPLRNVAVTFPPGFTLDPSAASGLEACSEAQVGWEENREGPMKFNSVAPSCPEASKIGLVELESPAVPGILHGALYLASQDENPTHSAVGFYLVVQDPVTGVLVKVAGRGDADPNTGQITGSFSEAPQLPFSDAKLHFFGGPRASFATPENCGVFTTTSVFEPWSAPDSGPAANPFDSFTIDSGCVTGFNPTFTAGSTNLQAGGYSSFQTSFSREDTDQEMGGLTVVLPPGLLGNVGSVPLCPENNATAGTCPETSLVGSVVAEAGPGPNPYAVHGRMYLAGPYKGAPYSLVVVAPAVAGPFDFGSVVVRQALHVDPHDAHVTDVSDPFPTILNATGPDGKTVGVPIRLRRVSVSVDRPGFIFNPTNCEPLAVGGTFTSTQGATANLSSHFQVANCANLPFHPVFKVSTQANTSKKQGASLTVKTTFPKGSQANIRSVAVLLPKQLPARLTTIQQACPAATFNANPASCPAGSNIGYGTATTPVLAAPFTGPAYLVSHGGAAFPDVVVVFQAQGVTLDLVGSVNIKHGITSSTFASIPDAPISSFQLTLPEGPHSGLAAVIPPKAKGNMCGQRLMMPFTITGQNGAQLEQNVKIAVTGCGKAKAKKKATRGAHGKRKTGKRRG